MSGELRAISIRQPWAHAILHLGKDVENRPMRTHYRGPILIQASLKVERKEAEKLKLDPDQFSTGAIVGSVEIVDCVGNSNSRWANRGQWHIAGAGSRKGNIDATRQALANRARTRSATIGIAKNKKSKSTNDVR